MRISITSKIAGLISVAVLIACLAVLYTTLHFMNQAVRGLTHSSAVNMQKVVQDRCEKDALKFAEETALIAQNTRLVEAIAAKDHKIVHALAVQIMQQSGSDFMTVSDEKNIVLGRGHSNKDNDTISNQETVVLAMQGRPTTGIVAGTVVPFSIRASHDVIHNGSRVGSFSIGSSLVADRYVDSLKATTGLEVTVFKKDTRVATTLKDERGKRHVGTKMANPAILEPVLQRGETVLIEVELFEQNYLASYWPIKNISGEIVGMWFAGIPVASVMRDTERAISISLWLTAGIVLLMLLFACFMGFRMVAPLKKTKEFAVQVADGQLDSSLTVQTNDEVGDVANALRSMVDTLKARIVEAHEQSELARQETVKAIAATERAEAATQEAVNARREGMLQAARELEGMVLELSTSSEEISRQIVSSLHGSEIQSSHAEITAVAMTQMNEAVLSVARSASDAAASSSQAQQQAIIGQNEVAQLVHGIEQVHNQAASLERDMATLENRATDIGKILTVINDIADQTNLLALNAAIEAARAGDAGRGFAVVADEVRKLAENTMNATRQVTEAVQGIQHGTHDSIQQLNATITDVQNATGRATSAQNALSAIVNFSAASAAQVQTIAAASEEQSATSDEITRAVAEISQITADGTHAMNQSAEAVENLVALANRLEAIINAMKHG